MERNVDAILSDLFSALQVFDPTNYIATHPSDAPSTETSSPLANTHPEPRPTDPMTETQQLVGPTTPINVPEAPANTGEKEKQLEGESPPSVTSPPGSTATHGAAPPVPEVQSISGEETEDASVEPLTRCAICLDDYPERDFLVIGPCTHSFCRNCLSAQAVHAARSGIAPVNCASCAKPLDGAGLLNLLLPEDAALLDAALARSLAGPVRYCVNPACGEAVAGQDGVGEFTCPRCGTLNPMGGIGTHDDALAVLAAERGWVPCPGCGNLASKSDSWSCNYTVCVCGMSFCLRCGKQYSPMAKPDDDSNSKNKNSGAGPSSAGAAAGSSSNRNPAPPQSPNQHGMPTCECGLYGRD